MCCVKLSGFQHTSKQEKIITNNLFLLLFTALNILVIFFSSAILIYFLVIKILLFQVANKWKIFSAIRTISKCIIFSFLRVLSFSWKIKNKPTSERKKQKKNKISLRAKFPFLKFYREENFIISSKISDEPSFFHTRISVQILLNSSTS
jgi:hypothetical protein